MHANKNRDLARIVAAATWILLALLALTIGAFWIRSYRISDDFMRTWSTAWPCPNPRDPAKPAVHEASGYWTISSALGSAAFWWVNHETVADPKWAHPQILAVRYDWLTCPPRPVYNEAKPTGFLGFKHHHQAFPLGTIPRMDQFPPSLQHSYYMTDIVVPYWALLAATALPLLMPLIRIFRRPRPQGLCPVCSYDLRVHMAGQAGDRCPECGTPLPSIETKS